MFIKRLNFTQIFWGTLCVLLLGIFVVDVLIETGGPRIRYADIDKAAAVEERNQKVVLHLNQPIRSLSNTQVTITPSASFTLTTKGDTVIVQLKERLLYDTRYEIKIADIQTLGGKESQQALEYSFSTPPATFFYLARNYDVVHSGMDASKEKDVIYESGLNGQSRAVFSTPFIQEYCRLKDRLIIATLDDTKMNRLHELRLDTLKTKELPLPEATGRIEKLRCETRRNSFGFVFTSEDMVKGVYSSVLFMSQEGAAESTFITGVDKQPLRVLDWQPAPDGASVLARAYVSGVLLVDTLGQHNPVPLGNFFDIGNFSFDGQSFIASDTAGVMLFNIPQHARSSISTGFDDQSSSAYALQNSEGRIERTVTLEIDKLVLRKGDNAEEIYQVGENDGNIVSYATSPNDQYLAATLAKGVEVDYDDYPRHPATLDAKTIIIDLATRNVIKSVNGFDVEWP